MSKEFPETEGKEAKWLSHWDIPLEARKEVSRYVSPRVSHADYADVVQDVFLKLAAAKNSGAYVEEGRLLSYARQVSRNAVFDWARKSRHDLNLVVEDYAEVEDPRVSLDTVLDRVAAAEALEHLRANFLFEVKGLPEIQRAALLLHSRERGKMTVIDALVEDFLNRHSADEIARVLAMEPIVIDLILAQLFEEEFSDEELAKYLRADPMAVVNYRTSARRRIKRKIPFLRF